MKAVSARPTLEDFIVMGAHTSSHLSIRFPKIFSFGTVSEHSEFWSLIAQISAFPGFELLRAPNLELSALSGGRSGALVLKITAASRPEFLSNRAMVVLKIAPKVNAAREKANYVRFVGPVLPTAFRPELLGFASTCDIGALCYACVSTLEDPSPGTLTHHLNRGSARALALVLQKNSDWLGRSWYDPAATRLKQSIADRYGGRFFANKYSIRSSEERLAHEAARFFGAESQGSQYAIGDAFFPSPATILFEKFKRLSYRSCVIHGDLNSDNVIVSPGCDLVNLVDFEHVGEGHVYEDLVSLEESIRINYPQDASFAEIFECERLIAENCPPRSENMYARAIAHVRGTAMRLFGSIEDASRYHFAVGAMGLRLMRAVDLTDVARARIAASTLWATRALAGQPSL